MQKWTWSRELHETNAIFSQLIISDYQTSPKYKVRKACRNCRRAHSRCSETRPCRACVNSGKAHTCDDGECNTKEPIPRNTARFHPWTQNAKDSTKSPPSDPLQQSFSNIKTPSFPPESGTGSPSSSTFSPVETPVEYASVSFDSQNSGTFSTGTPASGTPLSAISGPITPQTSTFQPNPSLPFGQSPHSYSFYHNRPYYPSEYGMYPSLASDPRSRSRSEDLETPHTGLSQFYSSVDTSQILPLRPTYSDPLSSPASLTPIDRLSRRRLTTQTTTQSQSSVPKWEMSSPDIVPIRMAYSDDVRLFTEPESQVLSLRQAHSETKEPLQEIQRSNSEEPSKRPTSISFLLN